MQIGQWQHAILENMFVVPEGAEYPLIGEDGSFAVGGASGQSLIQAMSGMNIRDLFSLRYEMLCGRPEGDGVPRYKFRVTACVSIGDNRDVIKAGVVGYSPEQIMDFILDGNLKPAILPWGEWRVGRIVQIPPSLMEVPGENECRIVDLDHERAFLFPVVGGVQSFTLFREKADFVALFGL